MPNAPSFLSEVVVIVLPSAMVVTLDGIVTFFRERQQLNVPLLITLIDVGITTLSSFMQPLNASSLMFFRPSGRVIFSMPKQSENAAAPMDLNFLWNTTSVSERQSEKAPSPSSFFPEVLVPSAMEVMLSGKSMALSMRHCAKVPRFISLRDSDNFSVVIEEQLRNASSPTSVTLLGREMEEMLVQSWKAPSFILVVEP